MARLTLRVVAPTPGRPAETAKVRGAGTIEPDRGARCIMLPWRKVDPSDLWAWRNGGELTLPRARLFHGVAARGTDCGSRTPRQAAAGTIHPAGTALGLQPMPSPRLPSRRTSATARSRAAACKAVTLPVRDRRARGGGPRPAISLGRCADRT